jgi:glycine cleavage system regulatory protein
MRNWMLAAVAVLALSACEDGSEYDGGNNGFFSAEDSIVVTGSRVDRAELVAEAPLQDIDAEAGTEAGIADPGNGEQIAPETYLAYRYAYGLRAPAEAVRPLVQQHQQACEAAGPSLCQIVNSNVTEAGSDRVSARLVIRAEPGWLTTFREGLEADAENAGGEVTSSSQSAEDLTRPILDTQARLDAQIQLRERLTGLLDRQGANIEELIRVERELARVNGDIESATAQLRAMRARVSMSIADLTYQSEIRPISQSTVNPVAEAFRDFAGIVLGGLAVMVRLIAGILPWLILIIPAVWLLARWRRSVNRRKAAEKAK